MSKVIKLAEAQDDRYTEHVFYFALERVRNDDGYIIGLPGQIVREAHCHFPVGNNCGNMDLWRVGGEYPDAVSAQKWLGGYLEGRYEEGAYRLEELA